MWNMCYYLLFQTVTCEYIISGGTFSRSIQNYKNIFHTFPKYGYFKHLAVQKR